MQRVERDEPAGEPLHLVPPVLLQVVDEREGEILVVLDDGDPRRARSASGGIRRLRRPGPSRHPNLPVM